MNRAARRQAAKEFQAQLAAGAVDLSQLGAKRQAAKPKTITLGYMYNDNAARPTGSWVRSLLALAARSSEFNLAVRPRECESGPFLSRARNILLKSFLETGDDYLLYSDTDIAFAPQDVAMLIAADAPIAGALCFSAALGTDPWPVALVEGDPEEDGTSKFVPVTLPRPPEDFDEADQDQLQAWMVTLSIPIPVASPGMGLTLIRREVAEKMAAEHEHPFEYEGDRGEDLVFCLRAAALGYSSIVMPAARVGHLKVGIV